MSEQDRAIEILDQVIPLAKEYYGLTGKELGITAQVGECLAAKSLGLKLCAARMPGYDAVSRDGTVRYQIKTRRIKRGTRGGRMPAIRKDIAFDIVLLIILDADYQVTAIHQAPRDEVIAELEKPGSKSRNVRNQLGISQFKAVARQVWPPTSARSGR